MLESTPGRTRTLAICTLCVFLAACGGHKDSSTTAPVGSATPASPTPIDAMPAIDAALWLPGDKKVPKEGGNDSPKMCMAAADCKSLCDAGDGAGCYWLGVMYATRSDVPMDVPYTPQKALDLFLQSCDLGITLGCNGAGQIFRLGSMDLPQDVARAQRLFQKACDLGMTGTPCEYGTSLKGK